MADLNPFSKVIRKQAGRAKERLLQNFGKADRTPDEDFDFHVKNFNKQQNTALRLQKEFKNYYHCLRAMQIARRGIMDTVCELYEPCWDGVDQFLIKTEVSNRNFEDFCDKINHDVLVPVANHVNQFPEITNKISKRNRKLLDYDNARHNVQNVETMRRCPDAKVMKARDQLDDAQHLFDLINTELHDELPGLYHSRVAFFATNLQTLFMTEADFHKQDATLSVEISGILEGLNEAYKLGAYAEMPRVILESPKNGQDSKLPDPDFFLAREGKLAAPYQPKKAHQLEEGEGDGDEVKEDKNQEDKGQEDLDESSSGQEGSTSGSIGFSTPPNTTERNLNLSMLSKIATVDEAMENVKPEPKEFVEGTPLEYNVLYKVQGTYKYTAEDVDELSFNVGDIIDVVAYDDPEEQEEGWLMGVFDGKKGLFPANFTSRI